MWGIRAAAILVGAGVALTLGEYGGAAWYVSLPAGATAYLVTRYIGWAVNERRRIKEEVSQWAQKARRGEPLH